MYAILLTIHHYFAFIALFMLAYATLNGFLGTRSEVIFENKHKKINTFALISTHIMLLLGLILLMISPSASVAYQDMSVTMKDSNLRKMFVEHPTMNIIAVILATIGNAKSKKAVGHGRKFKVSFIFFGLALVFLLSRLPFERLF